MKGSNESSLEQTLSKSSKVLRVAAAVTLTAADQMVLADMGAGAYTITMPPVAESRGSLFTIMGAGAGAGPVTIADQGDGITALTPVGTIAAKNQCITVMSNGFDWMIIKEI